MNTDATLRADMVLACKQLEAAGLNRGASGNISVRHHDTMLITPTAVGYDVIEPDMMAKMSLSADSESWDGPNEPSSEWRFHRDILRNRQDVSAVVHTHAPFSTILAIARKEIPAIHYMIAAFGGPNIRVADYARYGTDELSKNILNAMEGRNACLMANHGMVVAGPDLTRTLWLANELEALAHQYYHALSIGGGHILSDAQISETAKGFETYGIRTKEKTHMTNDVDLFIIGGGINGAGIARDAAGRGLTVVLCEKDDLAQGTSSRSGKLVHGGLRYLEYYEFRLVREALIEREVLLENASHIIWPMRFILPHSKIDRPAWLVRLGLFLYDHLGGRKRLPGTRTLNLRKDAAGRPLQKNIGKVLNIQTAGSTMLDWLS